jgi:hypothetical protein
MKKTLVMAILGIAATATVSGQGVIQFNNYASTTYQQVMYVDAPQWGAIYNGQPVTSPTFEVQLFWAIGTYGTQSSFDAVKNAGVTTFINPGINADGAYGNGPGGYYNGPNQLLTGWTPGLSVTFQVQGWETAGPYGGASYPQAFASGTSGLWTESQGATASANGVQPSSGPATFFDKGPPAMHVGPIPEPSMLALSGLGAAPVLISPRRKQS